MTSVPHEPANLDAETLRQRYADAVLLHERTQHVGRANRIFMRIHEIGERLIALGGTSDRELLPLLSHPSRKVRRSAAFDIRPFNRDLFLSVMESLVQEGGAIGREAQFDLQLMARREEAEAEPRHPDPLPDPNRLRIIDWQQDNPPPAAMSQRQLKDRVSAEFSTGRARQILALARPAIGLWPQRKVKPASPLASRHGGDVWAPADWQWPIYEEEPMCFLGQIYC
jgi:hypothetical protein